MDLIRCTEDEAKAASCKICGEGFEAGEGMLVWVAPEDSPMTGRRATYHWNRPDCAGNTAGWSDVWTHLDAQARALGLQ